MTVVGQKLRRKKGSAGDDRCAVTGTAFCLLSRPTAQPTLDAFVSAARLTVRESFQRHTGLPNDTHFV